MSRAYSALFLSVTVVAAGLGSAEADPLRRGSSRAEFYTQQVAPADRVVVQVVNQAPQQRQIRPRSMNAVDPGATVSRTPSGRIVIGPSPNLVVMVPATPPAPMNRPYAPPEFHMIGAASGQHASGPVKLTYGVQPAESFRPGPKVVWLDAAGRQPDDDAGGRIKRLK